MNTKLALKSFIAGLGMLLSSGFAVAETESSIVMPLATQELAIEGVRAGANIVVVGSRGHILLSKDEGKSWKQAKVPTRALLTGVYFSDEKHGWAVGHDAVILMTTDGGSNWEKVYSAPQEKRPLLDVWFNNDGKTGYAYGSYGYLLKSTDGGRTWTDEFIGNEDEPDDYHLNQVVVGDGVMYLAGEAGAAYRSLDNAQTWERTYPEYEGSFLGALPLIGDNALIFGLRGNVFRTEDKGETWTKVATDTEATLNAGAIINDGTVVLVGNEGAYLVSKDGGNSFQTRSMKGRKSIASIVPTRNGGALMIGEMGVVPLNKSSFK